MNDEYKKAIFYADLKGLNRRQLHQIAFEQITETANFTDKEKDIALNLLWEDWENPADLRLFLKQLNEVIQDFEWGWFEQWDRHFQQLGEYPYTWSKYRNKKGVTSKEVKIAVLYHSVHSRFAALRRYLDHYECMEACAWSQTRYQLRLSILGDDLIEKSIIESAVIIKENVLLALPPYIPAGRTSVMYERLRDR